MLINLLPFVSLICVPFIVYSIGAICALTNLLIIFPKLFTRNVAEWPNECYAPVPPPEPKYDRKNDHLWQKYYADGYCTKGERMYPENGTLYLQSSLYDWHRINQFFLGKYEEDIVASRIYRKFHTVIVDCPEMSLASETLEPAETFPKENDLSRIVQHLKWMIRHNANLSSDQPNIKVWFRTSVYGNNALRWDEHYCTALVSAMKRLAPETAVGFLLNSDRLTPLLTMKDTLPWNTLVAYWKKRADRLGLGMGLMLNWPSCLEVSANSSITSVLGQFDIIYHSRMNGYALMNEENGVSWIISSKFLECRERVASNAPGKTVSDVMDNFSVVIRYHAQDKFCRIYD